MSAPLRRPTRRLVAPTTKPVHSTAWWGMATLIATESMVFVILLGATSSCGHRRRSGRPPGIAAPELKLSLPFSFVLWGSSIPVFYAEAAIRRGSQRGLRAGLLVSAVMGAAFLAFTFKDFHDLTFGWRDNAYGSIFYTIVGLHALHVLIGLGMNVVVQIKAWQGKFSAERHIERRGVRPLLALRRRGVDLRLRVAVLVGGLAMTVAEVERIERAPALRRGIEVWYAAFGGIAAWTVHLLFVVSAEHWSYLHHEYRWTLHAATVVCAAVTIVALLLARRLPRRSRRPAATRLRTTTPASCCSSPSSGCSSAPSTSP